MSLSIFELLDTVVGHSRVEAMLIKRSTCPRFTRLDPIVIRVVMHKIDSQFTPYDELLKERIAITGRRMVGFAYGECHFSWTEVTKVEIW